MDLNLILIVTTLAYVCCEKSKSAPARSSDAKHRTFTKTLKTTSTTTEPPTSNEVYPNKTMAVPEVIVIPKLPDRNKISVPKLKVESVKQWAAEIRDKLVYVEKKVVGRKLLLDSFKDMKVETRDGAAILEKTASALEELLKRRIEAVEAIARQAEKEGLKKVEPPLHYVFDNSIQLGERKKMPEVEEQIPEVQVIPLNCSSLRRVPLKSLAHFGNGSMVELDITSVKVAAEVFDCDPAVLQHIFWSENLLHVFQQNYAQDVMTDFQYFCSAKGFMRHYPAASWESMFNLLLDDVPDLYDCRLRPWYVAAEGAPKDILILFDASGSMVNSTNKLNAEQFTTTLLNALTDDDQVNVLQFNIVVESPIPCFNGKLVPANYVNSAAMMAVLKEYESRNITDIDLVLEEAVKVLDREYSRTDKPKACQQAIVLLTDTINKNYTDIIKKFDPTGRIRVFVIWLYDPNGLRDSSRLYGDWLACDADGYFAVLGTSSDVTEQVMRVFRVLERPLVHQRKERIRVLSDLYAHVEDPRRSEHYWKLKEMAEQKFRYNELRRNKQKLLSEESMQEYHMRQKTYNRDGHYYEGVDLDYRFQISISVPVFDDTRVENITIKKAEYPVNRLLGVAGVDIPIEHLKLIMPYHLLGAGGSLFIVDHRGNIVLHENTKPVFDGDILKPGYRTVDMLDLEQSAVDHYPRNYSAEWLDFRKAVVVDQPKGTRTMFAKSIYEHGMRAMLEDREYFWKRVLDAYTVVISLPKYNRRHTVPKGDFTQELAKRANISLHPPFSDYSVHPDWMYCKHVERHFSEPEFEVRHFVARRKDEANFKMQSLKHHFSSMRPTLFQKSYLCNEELIARLCAEAIATEKWAQEREECDGCELGSVTAFFASESGLTRWQQYTVISGHAIPPDGIEWPRGPQESWYRRAVATPGRLVIHASVTPIRRMRRTEQKPPVLTERDIWLTAARTVEYPDKSAIGVAGFHFYPEHLSDILKGVTHQLEQECDECVDRCDGENWVCVLIDEGGWIVSGHDKDPDTISPEDPAREHLANVYPRAMDALLTAKVFSYHWIHDYQGVCFQLKDEPESAATMIIPSILKMVWRSLTVILRATKELVTIFALINSGGLVAGETAIEREKRLHAIRRNYQREQFDRLFDKRVLVNRTLIAACDRTRALYRLQRESMAAAFRREPSCAWPLVGAEVPETNLLLLAIYNVCPQNATRHIIPNPFVNQQEPDWGSTIDAAGLLACSRNRVQLPVRAAHTACFPHNYSEEIGYRQCDPEWKADPEVEDVPNGLSTNTLCYLAFLFAIFVHT